MQLQKGLQSLDRLADDAAHRSKEIDLQIALGGAFLMMRGMAAHEAEHAFSRALALCRQAETSSRFREASWGLWLLHQNRAELAASVADAAELLHYASAKDDAVSELLGHRNIAGSLLFQGKFSDASRHFAQTLALQVDIPRDLINQGLVFPWGTSNVHSLSSWALLLQGYFERALAERRSVMAYAREEPPPRARYNPASELCLLSAARGAPRSRNQSTELISLTAEQGFAHWHATGTIFRGWCVAVRGDREAGLAEMRRGLAAKQATGSELTVPYYLGLIAAFTDETAKEDAMGLFAMPWGESNGLGSGGLKLNYIGSRARCCWVDPHRHSPMRKANSSKRLL